MICSHSIPKRLRYFRKRSASLLLVLRVRDAPNSWRPAFLWVPTVSLALTRVRDRVLRGGHNVPETIVRRRFERSIRNFLLRYRPLADSWIFLTMRAQHLSSLLSRKKQVLV
jgi:hypothetical protein